MINKDGHMYKRVEKIIENSKAKTLFPDSDDEEVDVSISYNETEKILQ